MKEKLEYQYPDIRDMDELLFSIVKGDEQAISDPSEDDPPPQ